MNYFKETNEEINRFFKTAVDILKGKSSLNPKNTAMISIIQGCRTESDLQEKKADLLTLLSTNQIGIDSSDHYEEMSKYKYNIFNQDIIEELSNEFRHDIYNDATLLNYINYKRGNKEFENFSDVSYIFLTGNRDIVNIAWHQKIKKNRKVPLATTLDWITNKFWFKLQKGFGQNDFPLNANIIIKSKMNISALISDSINTKFNELMQETENGRLTEPIAKGRLLHLRNSARRPEEIEKNDLNEIIDFLNEDSLDRYIKEQEAVAAKATENEKENKELQLLLESNKSEMTNTFKKSKMTLLSQKKETIVAKKQNKEFLEIARNKVKKVMQIKSRMIIFSILFLYIIIIASVFYACNQINDHDLTIISVVIACISFSLPPLITFLFGKKLWLEKLLKTILDRIEKHEVNKYNFNHCCPV